MARSPEHKHQQPAPPQQQQSPASHYHQPAPQHSPQPQQVQPIHLQQLNQIIQVQTSQSLLLHHQPTQAQYPTAPQQPLAPHLQALANDQMLHHSQKLLDEQHQKQQQQQQQYQQMSAQLASAVAAAAAGGFGPHPPPLGHYPLLPPPLGFGLPSAPMQPRRKNATRETTMLLKQWLNAHRKNPYPSKNEKIFLAVMTNMSLTQVSTWFANARRRLKKENKMTWSPRNRCDDDDDDDDEDDDQDDDYDPELRVKHEQQEEDIRPRAVLWRPFA